MKKFLVGSLITISVGFIILGISIWYNYDKIVQKDYPLEIIEKNRLEKLQDGTCTK